MFRPDYPEHPGRGKKNILNITIFFYLRRILLNNVHKVSGFRNDVCFPVIEAEDKSKCRLFRWQVSQREKDSCRCGECGPSVSYILLVFL